MYHSVNAWEEGDEIVLDLCRVTKPEPRADAAGRSPSCCRTCGSTRTCTATASTCGTGATHEEFLDDDNTEFPSIDLSRLGRPNRYVYNVHISPETTLLFDGIVKYDVTTAPTRAGGAGPDAGRASRRSRRANAVSDDDGYLVSFVYDQLEDRSEVVILDAADITAGPVAACCCPSACPSASTPPGFPAGSSP